MDIETLKARYSTTSLKTFLTIYLKAHRECYLDHMEGASALVAWLSPIDMTLESKEAAGYRPLAPLALSYELHQLAKILWPRSPGESFNSWLPNLRRTERAILLTTLEI